MPEDDQPHVDPEPAADEEDEAAWQRLSPRLRGLIREELDEHTKRHKPAEPETPAPAKTPPAATEPERPKDDERPAPRPQRTAAERWFGSRRTA